MLLFLDYAFYFLAAAANLAFVILYGLTAKWWRNLLGRALFGESAMLAVVFGKTSIQIFTGQAHGVATLDNVLINAFIAAALCYYLGTYVYILVLAHRARKVVETK